MEHTPVEPLKRVHSKGRLPDLPTNVSYVERTDSDKHSSLFTDLITAVDRFIVQAHEDHGYKKLRALIPWEQKQIFSRNYINSIITDKSPTRTVEQYCIEGISETTRASSDIYCQSNNDNQNRTSCAFYAESIQVKHRQRTQKERERESYWGESDRTETEREYSMGFYRRQLFLVSTDSPKST